MDHIRTTYISYIYICILILYIYCTFKCTLYIICIICVYMYYIYTHHIYSLYVRVLWSGPLIIGNPQGLRPQDLQPAFGQEASWTRQATCAGHLPEVQGSL